MDSMRRMVIRPLEAMRGHGPNQTPSFAGPCGPPSTRAKTDFVGRHRLSGTGAKCQGDPRRPWKQC